LKKHRKNPESLSMPTAYLYQSPPVTAPVLHITSKSIYIIAAATTAAARGIEAIKDVLLDGSKDAAEEPDLVK
jgi:hypothetical protein